MAKTTGEATQSSQGEDRNAEEGAWRVPDARINRRRFLQMGAGAAEKFADAAFSQVDELRAHPRRIKDPDSLAEMSSGGEFLGFR
jgi:hypothetical protein